MKKRAHHRGSFNRQYLEALEARALLSVVPVIPAAWTIQGTDGNDVISVVYNADTKKFDLTINGVLTESRAVPQVRRIVINGGKGDDTISVDMGTSTRKVPVTINGGDGNDTLTGGAENDVINGGAGDDTISGGDGNDVLHGNGGNNAMSISSKESESTRYLKSSPNAQESP